MGIKFFTELSIKFSTRQSLFTQKLIKLYKIINNFPVGEPLNPLLPHPALECAPSTLEYDQRAFTASVPIILSIPTLYGASIHLNNISVSFTYIYRQFLRRMYVMF